MSRTEPTRNLLEQEIPQAPLFHYTSVDGLKGMVKGKTFWATNIEYLNDSSELRHGSEILAEVVKRKRRGANSANRGFFQTLDRMPPAFESQDIFVVSFSEVGDLLSQWRGYTPSALGFSIGFNPPVMLKAIQSSLKRHQSVELVKCAYSDAEKVRLAEALYTRSLNTWIEQNGQTDKSDSDLIGSSSLGPAMFSLFYGFVAAPMKDASFAEEREWRLIFQSRRPADREFRPGKSALVPYLSVDWSTAPEAARAVHSVNVGPCPHPDLSRRSVRQLLEASGIQSASVASSKIPFRAW